MEILEARRLGTRMKRLARTTLAAAIAATALMAAPPGAGAAATIGETFTPTGPGQCAPNTWLQEDYAAPSAGVITQWSFQAAAAGTNNVPQLKFKVGRPTGNTGEFMMIGESAVVVPAASTLNSYFV